MALNPEEIENMDSETMAIRAEAALREQQSQLAKEDLSDMVVYLCHDSIFYRNFRLLNMPPSRRISARDRSRKRIRSKRNTRSSSSNLRRYFNCQQWFPIWDFLFTCINIEVLCLAEIWNSSPKLSGPRRPSGPWLFLTILVDQHPEVVQDAELVLWEEQPEEDSLLLDWFRLWYRD